MESSKDASICRQYQFVVTTPRKLTKNLLPCENRYTMSTHISLWFLQITLNVDIIFLYAELIMKGSVRAMICRGCIENKFAIEWRVTGNQWVRWCSVAVAVSSRKVFSDLINHTCCRLADSTAASQRMMPARFCDIQTNFRILVQH